MAGHDNYSGGLNNHRGHLIHRAFGIFGPSMALFWVRGGSEIIVIHIAPSILNMSSHRTIWTHFRQNSMLFIN